MWNPSKKRIKATPHNGTKDPPKPPIVRCCLKPCFPQGTAPCLRDGVRFQCVKKASQSLPLSWQIESESSLAGACTWPKIPLSLQVWVLFSTGKQNLRAAGCKLLSEKPEGVFRQSKSPSVQRKPVGIFVIRQSPEQPFSAYPGWAGCRGSGPHRRRSRCRRRP